MNMGDSIHDGQGDSATWDQAQAADTLAIQQMLSSEAMLNGIGPGETIYVMLGEQMYQITGPSKPGGEVTIAAVQSGMSLDDLAAISAEQDSIKQEYGYQMPVINSSTAPDGAVQQSMPAQNDVFATNDGMQVIMVSNEDSSKSMAGSTIKLDGQDFVLPPGQQLPIDIQEMIAKGLPVDLSNYELVIDGEPGQAFSQNYTIQQGIEEMHALQPQLTMGVVAATDQQAKNGIYVEVVTATPGEYDDGEFGYLVPDQSEIAPPGGEPRVIPRNSYLNNYLQFVKNGARVDTTGSRVDSRTVEDKHRLTGKYLISNNSQMNRPIKRKKHVENNDADYDDKMSRNVGFEDPTWKLGSSHRSEDQRVSTRGRGKGRGRAPVLGSPPSRVSNTVIQQQDLSKLQAINNEPVIDFPVSYIMQNEPHNFFKGEFVVDRKDAYKSDFAIWRIENGKLLQKFDSLLSGQVLYHKSASVYSSWSGDIRKNFKPILADIVSASTAPVGRKQDIIVRVHDKYIPKPADDSLEQNALMQFFNIYVHVLLNQAFSNNYLASIEQQNVEYLLEPMAQIDQLIIEAKQAVQTEYNWNESFKSILETYSCYTFASMKAGDPTQSCQAIDDGAVAVKIVKFYGQAYDRDNLMATIIMPVENSQDFVVSSTAYDNLGIYHALHHFKYLLFKKCHEEASYQTLTTGKSGEEVPNICTQNRIWVQQMFRDLKGLLDRYIIIKTEEEGAEGNSEVPEGEVAT